MGTRNYILGPAIIFICANGNAAPIRNEFGEAWWAAKGRDGIQRVNIVCGEDFIDPAKIVLKANVPTELTIRAMDGLPSHSFLLNVPGLKTLNANHLITKEKTKHAFHPNVPGNFEAICQDNALPQNSAPPDERKRGVIKVIP